MLLCFWDNVCNPSFITYDDPVHKLIAVVMVPLQNVNADSMHFALCSDVSCYALCIQYFITNRTSQSAGAGIRACIFNCCNDATVRTWEVPLVQARSQGWARTGIARTGVICARPSSNRVILIETLVLFR